MYIRTPMLRRSFLCLHRDSWVRDPNHLSPRPKPPKPCNNRDSVEFKKSEPISLDKTFWVSDFVVNKFKLYYNQKYHFFFFQEFFNTLLLTVLYTVAFIVQISAWSRPYQSYYRNPNIAAGVSVLYYVNTAERFI